MSWPGRVALVTGAARGVGRAIALALAERGAVTVVVARSEDALRETTRLVEQRGGTAVPLVADLSGRGAAQEVLARAAAEAGGVEVLVNNAGTIEPLGTSTEIDPAAWAAAFDVNAMAPAALSCAALPHMLEAGWGRIANVTSVVVDRPHQLIGGNAYVSAKAALEAHTLNLAAELEGSGVTVNAYRPGSVDTAMQAHVRSAGAGRVSGTTHARFLRTHQEGGLISPEDSARALVDRLGDDTTGQIWDAHDAYARRD